MVVQFAPVVQVVSISLSDLLTVYLRNDSHETRLGSQVGKPLQVNRHPVSPVTFTFSESRRDVPPESPRDNRTTDSWNC